MIRRDSERGRTNNFTDSFPFYPQDIKAELNLPLPGHFVDKPSLVRQLKTACFETNRGYSTVNQHRLNYNYTTEFMINDEMIYEMDHI